MLRIPRYICFWPIAESAYKSQNAQFALLMYKKNGTLFNHFILNCKTYTKSNFFAPDSARKVTIALIERHEFQFIPVAYPSTPNFIGVH